MRQEGTPSAPLTQASCAEFIPSISSIKMKEKTDIDKELYEKIKKALENNKYNFRTISGAAKEAGVCISDVEATIQKNNDKIVVLFRRGKNGQKLITTREHYKKKASTKDKIMGALLNRVY